MDGVKASNAIVAIVAAYADEVGELRAALGQRDQVIAQLGAQLKERASFDRTQSKPMGHNEEIAFWAVVAMAVRHVDDGFSEASRPDLQEAVRVYKRERDHYVGS